MCCIFKNGYNKKGSKIVKMSIELWFETRYMIYCILERYDDMFVFGKWVIDCLDWICYLLLLKDMSINGMGLIKVFIF